MQKFRNRCAAALLGIGLCLLSAAAQAQSQDLVTDKDLEVAVRAFSFAYGVEKGEVNVEIVDDPTVPESVSEANRLLELIKATRNFAKRDVSAEIVPVAQMGMGKSKIAYITHGMQKNYDDILAKATAGKILTFSTDFQCVETGKCVMGVTGENVIKIEISRSATSSSGVEFSQALRLMIGEVN